MTPTCELCLNSQSERRIFNWQRVIGGTFESNHVNNNSPSLESVLRPLYRQNATTTLSITIRVLSLTHSRLDLALVEASFHAHFMMSSTSII